MDCQLESCIDQNTHLAIDLPLIVNINFSPPHTHRMHDVQTKITFRCSVGNCKSLCNHQRLGLDLPRTVFFLKIIRRWVCSTFFRLVHSPVEMCVCLLRRLSLCVIGGLAVFADPGRLSAETFREAAQETGLEVTVCLRLLLPKLFQEHSSCFPHISSTFVGIVLF